MRLSVTNYLDVISSWCFWATPAWQELRARYGNRVDFRWKIALMDKSGLPPTVEHTEWYYRRSGMLMRSPFMLSASWVEPGRVEYLEPNCVAEAARDFGIEDDRAWLALSRAELREGKTIGDWNVGAEVVAKATGLEQNKLLERAKSPAIEKRIRESTAEFHAMQVTQRPTLVIDSPIGDRAVFSGFAKAGPLIAAIDAMLDDIVGYEAYAAHFGAPPP
jgi:predicted DsbA family dithiol-disulfide isomerase